MEHGRLVFVDANSRLHQVGPFVTRSLAHDFLIDMRARHNDLDFDAAMGRLQQRVDSQFVGNKISVGQAHALGRRRDGGEKHEARALTATLGGTLESLRLVRSLAGQGRKIVVALQHATLGAQPIIEKSRLQLADDRAFHAIMVVAPMFFILGMAIPFIRNPDAAGESDFSVHDQQFAVSAIVQTGQAVPGTGFIPGERIVFRDLRARVFHHVL